jgi:K+-transporting ATPase ATPase B chain
MIETPMRRARTRSLVTAELARAALIESLRMLDPRRMARNPVMFVTEVGALLSTVAAGLALGSGDAGFPIVISIVLWLTVLFANFAEALAEARGKAQTQALRATRTKTEARRRRDDGTIESVASTELRKGDVIVISVGELIAADG